MSPLAPGDIVEIRFSLARNFGRDEHSIERWILAEILTCDDDAWPIARLEDGQVTELRQFMTWRLIARRASAGISAAA